MDSKVNAREMPHVSHLDPKNVMFSVFSDQDIKKLSVAEITTSLSFNILGHALLGGLYDPRLGPSRDSNDICDTCGERATKCPGHFGYIQLPVPVINPLFHKTLFTLLKFSCFNCHTVRLPSYIKLILSAKLQLLQEGFYDSLDDLEAEIKSDEFIGDVSNLKVTDIPAVRIKIEQFIEKVRNRERHREHTLPKDVADLNTKTVNMQWNSCVENVLKNHQPGRNCLNCKMSVAKITSMKNRLMTTKVNDDETTTLRKAENIFLMPDKAMEYLRKIYENDKEVMKVIVPCLNVNIDNPTDIFFYQVIPVLPPLVRPINVLGDQLIEHPQTQVYKSIIQDCLILKNIIQAVQDGHINNLPEEGRRVYEQIRGNNSFEKLHNAWQNLQVNVDHLMDRELSKTSESGNCQGLKQVIEKKEGVIRMHMMGKRVNFAARSVITPDPNLNIDEIGIPEVFACKLTYPAPVTPWNVTEMRRLIMNGPDVHPGAVMIEGEDGVTKRLASGEGGRVSRAATAKRLLTMHNDKFFGGIKIVHRHLQNGDMLLLNRQPTLHKPSIMAHKARILKGEKTLRLHYANCKAYNADFDGDEMNAHFPQNELARAEGYFIANVNNQYLVPKDGTPLSGLIQDHVVSGVRLTLRGNFFTKEDYMQLVFSALCGIKGDIITLPPSIIKPVLLWSGKQVVSTIIINVIPKNKARINLTGTAKINSKQWQILKPRKWNCGTEFDNDKIMSEAEVIIRNGELLCGILDKKHYGATPYGFIHCIFELYGGNYSSKMLSAFGKVFQAYLQRDGFTLGISDILVKQKADHRRTATIQKCRRIGDNIQKTVLELPEDTPMEEVTSKLEENYRTNPKFRALLDRKYKAALDVFTNDINKTCVPKGLIKTFPDNNLQLMVQSGAKGSTVNTMQISCLLGQIELEGKRPPLMISGKSLPSFLPYDSSPRAGGFIDGRFMTGIQPQEFFFHCMAGREGLIDTAVKTSRSGYLQRCLIKHMEGLSVNYDLTVRDSDGSLIQFYYGEDGLDILNSRYLIDEQIQFLIDNRDVIFDSETIKVFKENSDTHEVFKWAKKIHQWRKKNGDPLKKIRMSEFSKFSAENSHLSNAKNNTINKSYGRSRGSIALMKKWIRYRDCEADGTEINKSYKKKCIRCPDPVASKFQLDSEYGVLTERLESLVDNYYASISKNIAKEEIRNVLCAKVIKAICAPGEPVGLLAAQSIGEPSTQMTLNTFHFAGRGEMNVTLGIPRLREILMMASKNMKTPSLEIPFKAELSNATKTTNNVKIKLTKCVVSNILKNVHIERKLALDFQRQINYTLKIEILPYKAYKNEYILRPADIMAKLEKLFFKEIFREIKKTAKVTKSLLYSEEEKKQNVATNDEDIDELEANDNHNKSHSRLDLGEMHASSDEDEPAEDDDATAARTASRRHDNQEYEDPEAEEMMEDGDDDKIIDEPEGQGNKQNLDVDEDNEFISVNSTAEQIIYDDRRKNVLHMYPQVFDYDYDCQKNLWCTLKFWLPLKLIKVDLATIIKNVANKVILWETPNIKRAFTFQNQRGETILKTDGINIEEMFKFDKVLDLNKLYSNDIYGISQTYGIEAAYSVIVREIKDVFKMYGITVNSRHLSLIADYMTFEGEFKPLSRKGMEDSASPLQQMSFESSLNFLRNATLQGKRDDLLSPSSRLMIGQPCRTGTGAFDVLIDIPKILTQNVTRPQPVILTD